MPPKRRKSVSKKKTKSAGSKKKGSVKKKKSSSAKASSSSKATENAPAAPPSYGFVKLRIVLATFATKPHYPCHLTQVLRVDSPVNFVLDAIAQHHDNTVRDVYVFQGEIRGGDVMQTSDQIEPGTILSELGYEGAPQPEADATPDDEAEVLFYDYNPEVQNLTAAALVTQDEYFLKNILVPTSYSKSGRAQSSNP